MTSYIAIVQIILAAILTVVILLQAKGSGFSGIFGGEAGSIYRSRRGVERTLFRFTIGLAVVFVIVSLLASIIH
ncbi:MAG: preprotein translocase subunit SecG [Chloroflexi bacterium]|nr:preprotein translocase subunit SecG [Chloroflexota bacterium]